MFTWFLERVMNRKNSFYQLNLGGRKSRYFAQNA